MQSGSQWSVARQARHQPDPIIFHILYLVWWLDESCGLRTDQVRDLITIISRPSAITIYLGSPSLKVNMISLWKSAPSYTGLRWTGHTQQPSYIIIHTIQDTETVIHHQGQTRSSTVREVKQTRNQTILIISQQEPSYKSGSNNDSCNNTIPQFTGKTQSDLLVSNIYMGEKYSTLYQAIPLEPSPNPSFRMRRT